MKRLSFLLPVFKSIAYTYESIIMLMQRQPSRDDVIYARCFAATRFFLEIRRILPHKRQPLILVEVHELPDKRRARVLYSVDGIVAITNSLKRDLVKKIGVPAERIIVAPDGVPEAWINDKTLTKEEARQQLGIAIDNQVVVYTGRLYADSIKILAEAVGYLPRDIQIILVGPGEHSWTGKDEQLTKFRRFLTNNGYDNVRITGPVAPTQVRLFQKCADALIIPYTERLRTAPYMSPIKVFEYMATGNPIVAYRLPVLQEVLRHGENAYLVSEISGAALASGVKTVLSNHELSHALGRKALEQVWQYTWTARSRKILSFIEGLKHA